MVKEFLRVTIVTCALAKPAVRWSVKAKFVAAHTMAKA